MMKILKSNEFKNKLGHINENVRNRTIEIDMDIYLGLLQIAFNDIPDNRKNDASIALFPLLLELIGEVGVESSKSNPKYVVDNYTFNGDFISRKDVENDRGESFSDEEWETYCDETIDASLHDNNYALINF